MDGYRMSPSDFSGVDELLDFSDDHGDILHPFTANITASSAANGCHFRYGGTEDDPATDYHRRSMEFDFTDNLCVPSEDVAELEWLSNFVHDSFNEFPTHNITGTMNYRSENTRSRSKRTRAPTNNSAWTSITPLPTNTISQSPAPTATDKTSEMVRTVRQCTHCASEKTPQWRSGPLGPKTLCNACGVRFKSGRLVPEYRPAASPSFVQTRHSNSHRKVMELRRQKEMNVDPQQRSPTSEYQFYGGEYHHHHHRNNYEIC